MNAAKTMKRDRSKKGGIDEGIRILLDSLNSKGYGTTSSCSGRIVLLRLREFGDKKNSEWLYKTHEKADRREILNIIRESESKLKSRIYFLQEPPIIHVNCWDLQKAQKLLDIAMRAGFKHSGITSLKKFSVEIRGSERLETPVDSAADERYISMLVDEANRKLERGKGKIRKLVSFISTALI